MNYLENVLYNEGYEDALYDYCYNEGYEDALAEALGYDRYERDSSGYDDSHNYKRTTKGAVLHKEKYSDKVSSSDRRAAYREYVRDCRLNHRRPMTYTAWCAAYCD